MFQLRFVLLAALIPLAGIAAIFGGTGALHTSVMPPYEAVAGASAAAASGAVAEFASATVDAAAHAASDADVQQAISKGQLNPKAEATLLAIAGAYGAPSFALLVNVNGAVIARSGAESRLPDDLGGLPVVAEALTGVSRDGLWIDNGLPVHLAASAVYEGTTPNGGVVLGWAFTPALVAQLARDAGAPTVIVAGQTVVGALPEGVEPEAVAMREGFGASTTIGPLPILLPEATRWLVASRPLYPGDAVFHVVTLTDRDAAFISIATIQGAILLGTLVLFLLVIGIIFSALRAMERPIELISDHLSQVQQGINVGILPEAGLGPMLRLGKQINMLLQSMPSVRPGTAPLFGSASSSQDLPLPTVPTPAPSIPPSLGFNQPRVPSVAKLPGSSSSAGFPSPPTSSPSFSPPPSAPAMPSAPPQPVTDPAFSGPPQSGLAGLFDEGPDPLAAFRVPSRPPAAATAPPAPAPQHEHEMQPEATVMFQVPESLLAASAVPPAAPRSAPVDDNRTVVAQVPQELLAQVSPKNDVDAVDEAHYKEVYEKFVQTRIECGEDTSDLSYDRFVAKLLKNRQQIIEKHKAKSVRFQVYAKDGKAALRALPVRD